MSVALQDEGLSVEQYLAEEQEREIRHEYVAGEIFAMAGTTDAHNQICGNVYVAMHAHLRGGPCKLFMADVKARGFAEGQHFIYYPDLMVTCDSRDTEPLYKSYPKLIIEVLSDSTERHDRTEKFWNYIQMDTLKEYVLVAHDRVMVTIFRRSSGWKAEVLDQPTAEVLFESIGLKMLLSQIYEGIPIKATYFLETSFAKKV